MQMLAGGLLNPGGAEFWVLISFLIFIGLLVYMKVPAMITGMLDSRADAIRDELDQARRLREDAQALLADYKRKKSEAEEEAKEIIDRAKRDAEAMATETRGAMKESLARRMKMAEEKIARAEAQAVSEVQAKAVDSALAAAEQILKDKVIGKQADTLVDAGIKGLKANLLN